MKDIFILIEHRRGEIRNISFELLTKARELSEKTGGKVTALLLGHQTESFINEIKSSAHRIIVIEDEKLKDFNSEYYTATLFNVLTTEKPFLTLIGHTAFGIDIAPALGSKLNIPVATDCIGIEIDNNIIVTRQMYGGKLNATINFKDSSQFLVTVRQGAFPVSETNLSVEHPAMAATEITKTPSTLTEDIAAIKFLEYIEAATGGVDITKANIVIGIGRGVKEQENLKIIEDFAQAIGGVVGCSRPVADSGWLPKDRQVGSSGKTIKPKLYIAMGISGASQHISGMKGSETIIAINKDPNAPIFNEANYGIVDDLFKVIPALKKKIEELK
ncbi:MAG: electron transfer flavoprotein subunit alpha/FixB family protein [bacterium]|nr:electron transfer flavoprotein subunit alpha/FixB family protein [bacterium]